MLNKEIKPNNIGMIEGYQSISPLDVSVFPKEHRKQAMEQHYANIKEYKKEQRERPVHLRYENTILRIEQLHERDRKMSTLREQKRIKETDELYDKIIQARKLYNERIKETDELYDKIIQARKLYNEQI